MSIPPRTTLCQRIRQTAFAFLLFSCASEAAFAIPTTSLPTPIPLNLPTKDGVDLHVTYYPGQEGKKTSVVILIHGDKGPMGVGSGQDCAPLASFLQGEKHAVFVPDLRGYGHSKNGEDSKRPGLDRQRFRRDDIKAMVDYDMEALKKKIVQLHNEEKLNASLICVVGFEMGSVIALNWTRLDWNIESLPTLKQS